MKFLDLAWQRQTLEPAMSEAIDAALERGDFINGAASRAFEAAFAEYIGVDHCVGVGNGTDSLELILEAAGIGIGDEVIVPAMTFAATSEAVLRVGATPVLVDITSDGVLDIELAAQARTSFTRAVIVVHLWGLTVDVDALRATIGDDLLIIEDAAQAHGASVRGIRAGALGHAASFSFYPGKNLGAYGDAGAVVTDDHVLAERVRRLANHGRLDKFDHEIAGRNSRLDSIQGAVLGVKLPHLDSWVARRQQIAEAYLTALAGLPWLTLPSTRVDGAHAWHQFVIRVNDRDAFCAHLSSLGVPTGVHYPVCLPQLGFHADADQTRFPEAMSAAATVVSLPVGEHLTDTDVAQVVDAVKGYEP
jgi:dTDP-4-amino-4,6-dideoxygalactose transaminase